MKKAKTLNTNYICNNKTRTSSPHIVRFYCFITHHLNNKSILFFDLVLHTSNYTLVDFFHNSESTFTKHIASKISEIYWYRYTSTNKFIKPFSIETT